MSYSVVACPSSPMGRLPISQAGLLACEAMPFWEDLSSGVPGEYNITFSVTNDADLSASVNRTVVVVPLCDEGERLCGNLTTCSSDSSCVAELVRAACLPLADPLHAEFDLSLSKQGQLSDYIDILRAGREAGALNEPPVIKLKGSAVIQLPFGSSWELCSSNSADVGDTCDEGAYAQDEQDGDLTSAILACPPASCLERQVDCLRHDLKTKVRLLLPETVADSERISLLKTLKQGDESQFMCLATLQGISTCVPANLDALPPGTSIKIPFVVFDYGIPPLHSSAARTIVIVDKCGPGEVVCDGECSQVRLACVGGPGWLVISRASAASIQNDTLMRSATAGRVRSPKQNHQKLRKGRH